MLVKYAAKRTWPEKSAVWEHQGEAETAQAFAVEFATIEQLGVDVEFLVMEREGGGEIQFFRVAGTSPFRVLPAESRAGGVVAPAATAVDESEPEPIAMPSMSPVISMLTYMARVAFMAILVIAVLGFAMKYIRAWLS
ncbi:hypothetical protein [Thiobaca trueperi]|uniref:Uncharacterized protein n=1 Tax=Thiobaca trueperi TaxID=127458 RepID=A0A4V2V1C8_9GAMM|nr:hypothetical protein [Thiobaca trueperi]TCT20712.1 hypothetical protein EDC35_105151 [Thiobaca trueperi]